MIAWETCGGTKELCSKTLSRLGNLHLPEAESQESMPPAVSILHPQHKVAGAVSDGLHNLQQAERQRLSPSGRSSSRPHSWKAMAHRRLRDTPRDWAFCK